MNSSQSSNLNTKSARDVFGGNDRVSPVREINLLRFFSIAALIGIIGVGTLLVLFYRGITYNNLLQLGESNNVALVQSFENSLWPLFARFIETSRGLSGDELRSRPEMAELRRAVLAQMEGLSVVKVKVYNLEGVTVFSTQASQIGQDSSENAGFLSARSGTVVSVLEHRDTFSAFDAEIVNRDLISSYAPVQSRNGNALVVAGVLEIYDDVTPLLQRMETAQIATTTGVVLVLAALFAGLYFVVRHADRLLRRQWDEIQQVNGELAIARDHALQATEAKSAFLASMSHELRTPLNAVIGFSQVLQEQYFGKLNEKQAEYVGDILVSGKHLLSLINDVLDLSKIEAGKMEIELSPVKVKELLENSLLMIREKASKHGISLEVASEPDLDDLTLPADERKLKQIVFNLLSNAAKFTPDGGRIRLEGKKTGNELVISVADTGIGVAPEHQEKIFEEFYQVPGDSGNKVDGTGLGLPLTRRMVELHGGRIWVESEGRGRGSRFSFALPIPDSA